MHAIELNPAALARGLHNRGGRKFAFETVDLARTAHVVVDMQVGFLAEGSASEVPVAREIIPNVNAISRAVREAGGLNVFLRYTYDAGETRPWSSWYNGLLGRPFTETLAEHFASGAAQHALHPEIEVAGGEPVLDKTRFSGFVPGTCDLDETLRARGIDTIIVTGTLTNCCSEATARDAHQLAYKVIFVSDGNATLSDDEHNGTLSNLYSVFADIATTDELLETLRRSAAA